jgi:hypothetical protein
VPRLWFRVQGSGVGTEVGVKGLGTRVQGLGFGVQGSGFRVQGAGFRVQGSGFRVWGAGGTERERYAMPSWRVRAAYSVLDFRFRDLIRKDFQPEISLATKFTTQHDLY